MHAHNPWVVVVVVIYLIELTQMGKKLHKLTCTVQLAQVTVVCKSGRGGRSTSGDED